MKIHQLPMGARFEYEGQAYVKTGPMLATGPGGQRLIPRYAVLKVLGDQPSPVPQGPKPLSRQAVTAAFEAFRTRCRPLVRDDDHAAWQAACAEFLKTLD